MDATWDNSTSPPPVKFEASPAESFLSVPGEMYPSLFEAVSTPTATMNPLDIMTPESYADDAIVDLSQDPETPAASGEKKTKKRKSWGQVLPEPKTNLPPRYDAMCNCNLMKTAH
jgi:transcriptional activator HAC1